MRSIWGGSLSFGLINIPIKVYSASEERVIEFDMLHKKDLSPIRFARICKLDGKEVPYADIVKGYEYEKGEYIVVEPQDFKEADTKKTSVIDIQHFTAIEAIDPIYFDKPYYLEPDKKAQKAYQLLREALLKSNKVAIASYVFRNKEHIGIIKPHEEVLVLIQLRYHIEIRSFEELALPHEKLTEQEQKMALSFIEQWTQPFEPEKYHDTYTEKLMDLIEQKLKGQKPKRTKAKAAPSYQARDLMDLLKESLKQPEIGAKPKKRTHVPASSPRKSKKRSRPA